MENLKIPEKYRRIGLYIYCYKCNGYSNKKNGCLKKISDCNHPPERQVYKLKVHLPGTRNASRTKVLDTRDIKEVDKFRLEFLEELKNNNYNTTQVHTPEVSDEDRYLLTYQMDRYLKFITNGGFYDFEAPRILSKGMIKDYERYFRYFIDSIASSIEIKTFRIDEIQKEHIELFHKYIKKKTSSSKTYNNIMSTLKTFNNHLIKYEAFNIENLFNKVPVLSVEYDPQTFSKEEFYNVLVVTNSENGYDAKSKRNRFKDWLPTAFKLGLFTGLRLDELVHIKYTDFVDEDGTPMLKSLNIKANKLIGNNINKRIKRIPVIPELRKVLTEECNLELNKDSDEFIIAPELSRDTVKGIITKGFTHFKRHAGIDERKCFKELRTTYISRVQDEYGDINLTSLVSDHSNQSVVKKHYLDQKDAVKKSLGLRVFSEAEESVN